MMDPIDSWVDAAAVRRLAESLVAPVPDVAQTPGVDYGEGFVGFERATTAASEAPRAAAAVPAEPARMEQSARSALAGAREVAERGGILGARPAETPVATVEAPPRQAPAATTVEAPRPSPVAIPARPAVTSPAPTQPLGTPEGLFMERLRAYGDWLHKAVSAKAFFVADREGDLLIDEINSPKLLQVARTLAQASWTASRQAGNGPAVGSLHVKLGAGSVLEVLPVASQYGPLILAIIVPGLLPAATVQVVASSLQRVVDGPIHRS